jgi:hypothetical protein
MILQAGGVLDVKTGFSDLQNVAKNYCVIQRLPNNFAKTNIIVGLSL